MTRTCTRTWRRPATSDLEPHAQAQGRGGREGARPRRTPGSASPRLPATGGRAKTLLTARTGAAALDLPSWEGRGLPTTADMAPGRPERRTLEPEAHGGRCLALSGWCPRGADWPSDPGHASSL